MAEQHSGIPKPSVGNQKGYFADDSMIRKIYREAVVLLGGGYAVLLQLAHPFVTAGVDDYSHFQEEILKRLYGTVEFMHELVFEDRHNVNKAIEQFHKMHERIHGKLGDRAGNLSPDTHYSGTDPQAMLWVFATFVDTGWRAYEKFKKPLSIEEKRQYYSECLILAALIGVKRHIVPQSWEDFQQYMNDMLGGDTLVVTARAKELGHAVLYPNVSFFPGLSARLLRFVTAGLLPDRFRKAYGLTWNKSKQVLLNAFAGAIRFLRPVVPGWVWKSPLGGGRLTYFLLWGGRG